MTTTTGAASLLAPREAGPRACAGAGAPLSPVALAASVAAAVTPVLAVAAWALVLLT